jgi:hypothetical protein
MKRRGEMRRERRRMKGRRGEVEMSKEMEETGWRLKKTRMRSSGLY